MAQSDNSTSDAAMDALRALRVDVPALDDSVSGRIYAASLRRASAPLRPPERAARLRRTALRLSLVVVIVIGVLAVGSVGLRTPTASAADVLERAAVTAAGTVDASSADQHYQYIDLIRHNGPENLRIQTWISIDGSQPGRRITTNGMGATKDELLPPPTGESLQDSSPQALAELPTDPPALLSRLADDRDVRNDIITNGTTQNVALWEEIRQLSQVTDSATQAALFRAATQIEGLTVAESVADAEGRVGTAVSMTDPRLGEIQLIFAADGTYLGERVLAPTGRTQFVSARISTSYVAGW